jgi:hypothetical protein
MRIQSLALAIAAGALWGGAILMIGVAEFFWPAYGRAFLELAASIYPGYDAGHSVGQVLLGAAYGFADGAIGGFLLAWIHNRVATGPRRRAGS